MKSNFLSQPIFRMLRFNLALAMVLSTVCCLQAAPGKSSSNYLKVDVGARAVALGGVQYGAQNDAFAPFYNPALFAYNTQKEIGFMHNQYFEQMRQDVLSYIHPGTRLGNLGVSVNYFSYGSIDGFDETGAATGGVDSRDIALAFSWSKIKTLSWRNWSNSDNALGASIKFLNRKLANESAIGFALDLGFSHPLHWKYLRGAQVGLAVQNLGPGIKFGSDSSPLPQLVRLGMVKTFFGSALVTSGDIVYDSSDGIYPAIGLEYKLLKMLDLRMGYKGAKALEKKLTYGVGFENPLFRVDYAVVPFSDLGTTHRVSLNYFFGRSVKHPKVEVYLQEKLDQAQTLYAQGALVDAYLIAVEINRIAPWLMENTSLLSNIQKDFKQLEESAYKENMRLQISAILTRGEKYYEQGNLINARTDFLAVLGIDPSNRAAEGYLKQIDAQFTSFVDSFYRNGMIAFASENYTAAKEEFEKVLTINPNHADAKIQLERCIKILEQKEQQVADAVKQDTLEKTWTEAKKAYNDGKLEDSLRLFNAVLELQPSNEEAKRATKDIRATLFNQYAAKGKAALERNDLEAAVKNFKSALEHNSNSPEIRNLLKNTQAQWAVQRKALSQNLYRTGLEAFLAGDKNKAREIWQKALTMDPDNEEAKRGLNRMEKQ